MSVAEGTPGPLATRFLQRQASLREQRIQWKVDTDYIQVLDALNEARRTGGSKVVIAARLFSAHTSLHLSTDAPQPTFGGRNWGLDAGYEARRRKLGAEESEFYERMQTALQQPVTQLVPDSRAPSGTLLRYAFGLYDEEEVLPAPEDSGSNWKWESELSFPITQLALPGIENDHYLGGRGWNVLPLAIDSAQGFTRDLYNQAYWEGLQPVLLTVAESTSAALGTYKNPSQLLHAFRMNALTSNLPSPSPLVVDVLDILQFLKTEIRAVPYFGALLERAKNVITREFRLTLEELDTDIHRWYANVQKWTVSLGHKAQVVREIFPARNVSRARAEGVNVRRLEDAIFSPLEDFFASIAGSRLIRVSRQIIRRVHNTQASQEPVEVFVAPQTQVPSHDPHDKTAEVMERVAILNAYLGPVKPLQGPESATKVALAFKSHESRTSHRRA